MSIGACRPEELVVDTLLSGCSNRFVRAELCELLKPSTTIEWSPLVTSRTFGRCFLRTPLAAAAEGRRRVALSFFNNLQTVNQPADGKPFCQRSFGARFVRMISVK